MRMGSLTQPTGLTNSEEVDVVTSKLKTRVGIDIKTENEVCLKRVK